MQSVLNELQLIVSMFNSSQIRFDDPDFGSQLMDTPEIFLTKPHTSISLTIKLRDKLEIDIRIPVGYPGTEKLSASCRLKGPVVKSCETEGILNNEIIKLINSNSTSSPCDLLSLINFCYEKWESLKNSERSNEEAQTQDDFNVQNKLKADSICRIWIHSHHIYNINKRKFLVEAAADRKLTGFSLPGKPGFVCVEGFSEDCEDYWLKVRQLNWQKISLIQKELNVIPAFLKPFEELHCDKSGFIKYLEAKCLDEIIKQYLGF